MTRPSLRPRARLAVVAMLAACANVTAPIPPCEYVSRPLTDSTSAVAYKALPCWDANIGRTVRAR